MSKNIRALILFLICFGHANAQDVISVDSCRKEPEKKEAKFHSSAELQLGVAANMSLTYNGTHMDLLPTACYGARVGYGKFSIFAHGINCFTSLPMPEQKYKLFNGELCFGATLSENDKKSMTIKIGKFLFSGKYGLASRRHMFSSTDVLYDMFSINNDRSLNRGCALIHNNGRINVALGYTEQDQTGGLHFNGNNANLVVSGGYDGKVISAQFIGFYSIKDQQTELNFYVMCTPTDKDIIIGKALGIASAIPIYELAYAHKFQDMTLGAVAIVGKNEFANLNCTLVFPCQVSVNVGVVNNDPYFDKLGLNPKIGIGYCYQITNQTKQITR